MSIYDKISLAAMYVMFVLMGVVFVTPILLLLRDMGLRFIFLYLGIAAFMFLAIRGAAIHFGIPFPI